MVAWMTIRKTFAVVFAFTALIGLIPSAAAATLDDCAGFTDASSSWSSASELGKSVSCTGRMDPSDSADWYYIDVSTLPVLSTFITITICPTTSWDPDLRVYFESGAGPLTLFDMTNVVPATLGLGPGSFEGSSVAGAGSCDTVATSAGLVEGDVPQWGRWYIQVDHYSGAGDYTLGVYTY